jgi:hypothetical protein
VQLSHPVLERSIFLKVATLSSSEMSVAVTPGKPAVSGDILDIRAFDDYRYYSLISDKYNVVENRFGSGKDKYGAVIVTWYSDFKNMTEIPCIIDVERPSVTAPFNRRGRMKQIKIFGNQFHMFSGYLEKQGFSADVTFKRRTILYSTMDERMDRQGVTVENASTKFFSVEGMLFLFWQLRFVDSESGDEMLMGSIPGICSLSDVDVHCYMRTHLVNSDIDTVAYFNPEIAKVTFSPARSVVLVGFYEVNECSFVTTPSFVLDKIAFNSDFIVSHRSLPHKDITPETGYCLPDGYEFVVWRRGVNSTENEFMRSDVNSQIVNLLLETNVEMHAIKPFAFSHHQDGNHFMVVYYIMLELPQCDIKRLSSITLLIMKQASRALDDYAYYSSPNTYRVVKTMEHFRFIFQMMQYLTYVKKQGYTVFEELQALSILQAAVLLSFAKPLNQHRQVYEILDKFCDLQQASPGQLASLDINVSSKILFKRSKSDGRVRYGRSRYINDGKYAVWNWYMSQPSIGMLYSSDNRMMYVLSNIFIASPATLQMIGCVTSVDAYVENIDAVSRQIGLPTPYAVGIHTGVCAYADNATVVVNEHDGVLLRGHRRLLRQRDLPKSSRAVLVDEDEPSVACSSKDIVMTPAKTKSISFFQQSERARLQRMIDMNKSAVVETIPEEPPQEESTIEEVASTYTEDIVEEVLVEEEGKSALAIGMAMAEKILIALSIFNALSL